jgi:SAM-dependent methyltransferase
MSYVYSFVKKAKVTLAPNRNRIAGIACGILRAMPGDQPLRVLDIGCAWGDNLAEIHERCAGWGRAVVPFGIEISRYLADESQARVSPFGGKVICASAVEGVTQMERESIDLALLSSLLEHEYQPLQLLQGLHGVLAAEGAVAIKVPNFASWNRIIRGRRWCGFRFPDHVNYFTPKTLQRLAEEAGFTVARQNVLDRFPLSDSMYAVLVKRRVDNFV